MLLAGRLRQWSDKPIAFKNRHDCWWFKSVNLAHTSLNSIDNPFTPAGWYSKVVNHCPCALVMERMTTRLGSKHSVPSQNRSNISEKKTAAMFRGRRKARFGPCRSALHSTLRNTEAERGAIELMRARDDGKNSASVLKNRRLSR